MTPRVAAGALLGGALSLWAHGVPGYPDPWWAMLAAAAWGAAVGGFGVWCVEYVCRQVKGWWRVVGEMTDPRRQEPDRWTEPRTREDRVVDLDYLLTHYSPDGNR